MVNLHPDLADNRSSPYLRLTDEKKKPYRDYERDDARYFRAERERHYRDYDSRPILPRVEDRPRERDRYMDNRDYIR